MENNFRNYLSPVVVPQLFYFWPGRVWVVVVWAVVVVVAAVVLVVVAVVMVCSR